MLKFLSALSIIALAACADGYLDDAELEVTPAEPSANWSQIEFYARGLSRAYVGAARKSTTTQDVQSFLVFLSAGVFVRGLVDGDSNAKLADSAIAGAASQQIGLRIAPKSAIVGMYVGAKRLNCIATVTSVGSLSFSGPTDIAARALAFGAIEEVKITTRESLVREIADYDKLVTDIIPPGFQLPSVAAEREGVNDQKLKVFSAELAKCLAKKAET
ncbi:MAG: hypothetical protein OXQ30_11385 [Boseongicola sp.]|nr:hypothetical protein [Boseongicola sp.]